LLTKKGRARSLKPLDEFFMVMCRLRQGFPEDHLANFFNVSTPTVRRILITWVNFMYFKFGQINIWPSREIIRTTMPERFTIQDLLPLGVTLNLPPFLGASAQMAAEDVVATQEIASLRIHVER
ncbi:unnamed protein product, partial [Porites lobata]